MVEIDAHLGQHTIQEYKATATEGSSKQAPHDVTFHDITFNSFQVNITPREGHPAVERYELKAKEGPFSRSCMVAASVPQLSCWMFGLSVGREYTVSVVVCLPGVVGCGPALVRKVRTGETSINC